MCGVSGSENALSIMYVEDDPVTRELVAQTLPKRFPDYTVRTAENGQLGLELFRKFAPDIVITDVNMPVMNGILMASEMKAINPDVVIIAVTAYSETNYLLNAIEIGISHYVLKPIDYKKLFEAIEKSSVGICLRKQFAEQNNLIGELNACLEQQTMELCVTNKELEKLSQSVSHELRAPIAYIRKYSKALMELEDSLPVDRKNLYLRNILIETGRMERMIERLREFSRLGICSLAREKVNLSLIASEIAERLRLEDPSRHVDFVVAPDVTVQGDERLMRVVLENLMWNAWKYTGGNATPLIEFGSVERGIATACFVKDNGVGFDQQDVRQIFTDLEPCKDDDYFAGYGMGLATVYRIIRHHGGTIEATGEIGKGATFTFWV